MKKILITGGMGFLGRQCVKIFLEKGYDVVSTDKVIGADLIGDLTNPEFVRSLPEVNTVVNCSAVQYVTKDKPFFRQKFFISNNVLSAKLLSERYKENTHFIHIGTSMMYHQEERDIEETFRLGVNGSYSKSKYDAQFHINNIVTSATIIPCIIGGVGREGLFRPFVKMIESSPVVLIPGDGCNPIHMVHVDDVANLIFLVAIKKSTGFFNAASPVPLTIRDWIKVIANSLGRPFPKVLSIPMGLISACSVISGYRLLAREQVLMLNSRHVLSTTKSMQLGWLPKYSNLDICAQMADYLSSPP